MLSSEERRRHRSTPVRYESILTISVSRSVTGSIRRENALSRKRKILLSDNKLSGERKCPSEPSVMITGIIAL